MTVSLRKWKKVSRSFRFWIYTLRLFPIIVDLILRGIKFLPKLAELCQINISSIVVSQVPKQCLSSSEKDKPLHKKINKPMHAFHDSFSLIQKCTNLYCRLTGSILRHWASCLKNLQGSLNPCVTTLDVLCGRGK